LQQVVEDAWAGLLVTTRCRIALRPAFLRG
jgi:hypothetical protein